MIPSSYEGPRNGDYVAYVDQLLRASPEYRRTQRSIAGAMHSAVITPGGQASSPMSQLRDTLQKARDMAEQQVERKPVIQKTVASRTAAAQPQAPQPQERLEPVRLLRPHTHQGRSYPAGHTLAVTAITIAPVIVSALAPTAGPMLLATSLAPMFSAM